MRTTKELLKATGYTMYVDDDVLATAPRSSGKEKVEIFTIEKYATDNELEKEYKSRGFVPADLDSLVSVHSKEKYVATHWKDVDGNWCYAAFDQWGGGERGVSVNRYGRGWSGFWWFAGVRKSSILEPSAWSNEQPTK